jgi:hypothetical protein
MKILGMEGEFYLPQEYIGLQTKKTNLTKNAPRKWTAEEIEWLYMLKDKGFTTKEISKYLYREKVSVSLKIKRLAKKNGKTYNEPHRAEKYKLNRLFLDRIQPKNVLDLFSGERSYYINKVESVITNDVDDRFNTDYTEKAEKLVCKLYYEGKKYDLIDVDPFGSAYDCFDLSIKMAKKAIVITLGEIGHKRWKRLDFVRRHYGIDSLDDFNSKRIVEEIVKIGARNKKILKPIFLADWRNISRVYFEISNMKITEQWNKKQQQ